MSKTILATEEAMLQLFKKLYEFFVGVDSDGCAFDSMEVKHKNCFEQLLVLVFGLAAKARYARGVWDRVNLYSKTRGCNRWLALQMAMRLLIEEYPELEAFLRPHLEIIDVFVAEADKKQKIKLGNPGLMLLAELLTQEDATLGFLHEIDEEAEGNTGVNLGVARHLFGGRIREFVEADTSVESCLARLALWSFGTNFMVSQIVHNLPPFPSVRPSLELLKDKADKIVCSATPGRALWTEWEANDMTPLVQMICGQEPGKKTTHLVATARRCGYPREKTLFFGDGPGDKKAADENDVQFYPITPTMEEACWRRFLDQDAELFLAGRYHEVEADRLAEFDDALPEDPPVENYI